MPRTLLFAACSLVLAVTLVACDGDGDEDPTPTATTAAAPSPTVAVASPTPAGTPPASTGTIVIDQPLAGLGVQSPFRVNGTSNVFEAVSFVQLVIGDEVVCERRVMATSGTGTPGTWETLIAIPPPPETTPAVLRAFSRSANDGSEENVVTRNISVTADVPAIVIDTPTCNTDVQALGTLQVSGTASVFEAALSVDLIDITGSVLQTQIVTATTAAPERGDWTTTFDLSAVPTGTYEIAAYSISSRDGSVQNLFIVPIRITT